MADGRDGRDGRDGAQGIPGVPGADGKDGRDGVDGRDGKDGVDGLSAYQIAVAAGFSGTETEWLLSLVGPRGEDGAPGADGRDGRPGADGRDGRDGAPGISPELPKPAPYFAQFFRRADHHVASLLVAPKSGSGQSWSLKPTYDESMLIDSVELIPLSL